jgi:outer membrane protein, adhesin transport system
MIRIWCSARKIVILGWAFSCSLACAQTGSSASLQTTNLKISELHDLLFNAVATHPSIQTQQALIGAAQQGLSNARWQYFPTPSLSVQSAKASSTDTTYAGDARVTVLALNQPLWSGGRIEAGIDKAQAYALGAQASLTEAQQQLAIRVVQTYGDWLSAYRKRTTVSTAARTQLVW